MRFFVGMVMIWLTATGASWATDDIFAFTPPPDTGMVETPYGPVPAIRNWREDTPQALVLGIKAYDAEDYETAKKYLLPLVEAGHAVAQKYLGRMHSDAQGFKKRRNRACDLYESSALLGYRPSQFNLGTCFLIGSGRQLDRDQSIRWFYPGAMANEKHSLYKISIAYFDKKDQKKYLYWLRKTAEQGSIDAKLMLRQYEESELTKDVGLLDYICAIYGAKTGKPYDYCDD